MSQGGIAVAASPFAGVRRTFSTSRGDCAYYQIHDLEKQGLGAVSRLPWSLKILLESAVRQYDGFSVTEEHVELIANWNPDTAGKVEISFKPGRVVLQDFTGVPSAVDLAAMRSAMQRMGGDPARVNPVVPVDLVIDHSLQVDQFGSRFAHLFNAEREFERNGERYEFLKWSQSAFEHFRVVPPATGIVHQVNLEFLAQCVMAGQEGKVRIAYPDSVVGADSHTTMINGLGVLGWGVGGIEAEAAMLGQPLIMLIPEVIGFKLHGRLPEGATATDLVLTIVQMLRAKGVVEKFVEFYGPGLSSLALADRATIGNMAPEYGATVGFFPVDSETLEYLKLSNRSPELISLVEAYCKEQGLFRTDETPDPVFTDTLELDLSEVEPSLAGPRRPQDRVPLSGVKQSFAEALPTMKGGDTPSTVPVQQNGDSFDLTHGSVVISAITSCTNTSNPSVMVGAGLLARKAVARGLKAKPWVKTSLAPGSKVVTEYLTQTGLLEPLGEMGFHLVGYGCTTCVGNGGPLPENINNAIQEGNLVTSAVLSGNRNFEGRIHPSIRANYLASPPLVVAYAIAGNMDVDLYNDPIGEDADGKPVMLSEIWPSPEEVRAEVAKGVTADAFRKEYSDVFTGDDMWRSMPVPEGELFAWDEDSTYVRQIPFFGNIPAEPAAPEDIQGARVLALLGDSVTTDHISPAGSIERNGPAARYLTEHGVEPKDFNQYGARRGNHEVMMRGTFANVRLRNQIAPGTEGGFTVHQPDNEQMSIFDAAMKYQEEGTPLIVIAGKEYGTGSSRDWAAKGPRLLGVKAAIVESFERIHRSNLIGMGILPLEFVKGENAESLGLTGFETYDITGVAEGLSARKELEVTATSAEGKATTFRVTCRIDTPAELAYHRHGGILEYVLRQLAGNT